MSAFIGFFSDSFGYVLNYIYNLVQNYGLSIILFSILLKIILLPLSVKQHKTMMKTSKIQTEMKAIQTKYKKEPEKMNKEVMELYKRNNMSPFSGCSSVIVQMILLFAIFFLVRNPLTHMKKIDPVVLENYTTEITQEIGEEGISTQYSEISVVKYVQGKDLKDSEFYINMEFLGLDLSNVPQENFHNWTVYIIPVLYVLSSTISIRLINSMNAKNNKKEDIIEVNGEKKEPEEPDMAAQMSKTMTWMMPIMSVSISIIAPLGLALYWLINNVLMVIEKLILNKVLSSKEEEKNA